jgi:hypothetical protein
MGWLLVEEGRKRSAPRNAKDKRHGYVMDLLFASVEAQRLVIREMKPPSSANDLSITTFTLFADFELLPMTFEDCEIILDDVHALQPLN